jgi:hypothetical protein
LLCGNSHAARYNNLDYGVFGLPLTDAWNWNAQGQTINSLDDAYSASFTAMENLTIDRAMQRFVQVDAGTTLRIGLQADNGSGAPSGTWLTDTIYNPPDGDSTVMVSFASAVNLVAGNAYHLVTQPQTLGAAESMFVYASSSSNAYRPYDRTLDPMHRRNSKTNGGAWVASSADPWVAFANGSDTNYVAQPSQPYGHMGASSVLTQGGGGARTGMVFRITEGEVPVGATVRLYDATIRHDHRKRRSPRQRNSRRRGDDHARVHEPRRCDPRQRLPLHHPFRRG